jgi:hypothetical protein
VHVVGAGAWPGGGQRRPAQARVGDYRAVRAEQHIAGRQAGVREVVTMQPLQRVHHGDHQPQRGAGRQRAGLRHGRGQRRAAHQGARDPGLGGAAVVRDDAGEVRAARQYPGEHARLQPAADHGVGEKAGIEELDRRRRP